MSVGKQKRVMVVGGGGREHAICWKLAQSANVEKIYCAPGNGGTATESKTDNIAIGVMDFDALAKFSLEKNIDLVVVGPDDPLAAGLVDHLESAGLKVFGPRKAAAQLEASKVFAKDFMVAHRIPTARYIVGHDIDQSLDVVREHPWARVIKADGLALGKGVFVCDSDVSASEALRSIFTERKFGDAGNKVLLEETLRGEELSLLLFCDGDSLVPMPPCQDHKRRFDGDKGPNTGGMGAYSPVELYDRCADEIESQVLRPLRAALASRSVLFKGVLFIGLMIESKEDDSGSRVYQPYVLEFNARFGDPETQVLMPLLMSDLFDILMACVEGKLSPDLVKWKNSAACTVVAAAKSYPESGSKGEVVTIGSMPETVTVFQAGTKLDSGSVLTNGGRVLAVTGIADTIGGAVANAYAGMESIDFLSKSFRKDIAGRAVGECLSR